MESRPLAAGLENLRALDVGLTTAALGALTGLAEEPERSWARRSSLPWA